MPVFAAHFFKKPVSKPEMAKQNGEYWLNVTVSFRCCHALLAMHSGSWDSIVLRSEKGCGAMLTSVNALIGLPAVWQDQQVGWIEQAVANPIKRRLEGLVLRRGIGSARWTDGADVLSAGRTCVLLQRKPMRLTQLPQMLPSRAFLTTGEDAGEVTDALLDGATLQLAALEICQGPLYRLMGRRAYAADFCIRPNGDSQDVVAARLLSWTQLLRQLGEEENP